MPIHPSSLILVAVMNHLRDLEIARVLGWYRIPLRSAPKVVAVDQIAFYQTGVFGSEKWQIRYTAPVLGHELTTRQELLRDEPDHPHAKHEYYKMQLGSLEQVEPAIPAMKWRRISFFYTTGEYFLRAKTIDELIVASNERPILWRALRERAAASEFTLAPTLAQEVDLDPVSLALVLGFTRTQASYRIDLHDGEIS
jgi:hypothetical protein